MYKEQVDKITDLLRSPDKALGLRILFDETIEGKVDSGEFCRMLLNSGRFGTDSETLTLLCASFFGPTYTRKELKGKYHFDSGKSGADLNPFVVGCWYASSLPCVRDGWLSVDECTLKTKTMEYLIKEYGIRSKTKKEVKDGK